MDESNSLCTATASVPLVYLGGLCWKWWSSNWQGKAEILGEISVQLSTAKPSRSVVKSNVDLLDDRDGRLTA